MTSPSGVKSIWRGVWKSLLGAAVLLFWDAIYTGSSLFSLLICPIWVLVSIVGSATKRPGWTIALIRLAIPVVTLVVVMQNDALQRGIAETNARKLIAACETFHADHDRYPQTLDELVPKYVPSVPRAKYCMVFGNFWYFCNDEGDAFFFWHVVPPYGRKTYDFKDQRWGYLD